MEALSSRRLPANATTSSVVQPLAGARDGQQQQQEDLVVDGYALQELRYLSITITDAGPGMEQVQHLWLIRCPSAHKIRFDLCFKSKECPLFTPPPLSLLQADQANIFRDINTSFAIEGCQGGQASGLVYPSK